MKTPNKATKLKWMNDILDALFPYIERNGGALFTCNLVSQVSWEAGNWYHSVLTRFVNVHPSLANSALIEMFHDKPNQLYYEPRSVENRIMWLFMLKTLVEDGQL